MLHRLFEKTGAKITEVCLASIEGLAAASTAGELFACQTLCPRAGRTDRIRERLKSGVGYGFPQRQLVLDDRAFEELRVCLPGITVIVGMASDLVLLVQQYIQV